jgi:hypothetical protein
MCAGYGGVPEAADWELMPIGLGVVGALSRARRTTRSAS